jgi:hypothetical protein
MGGVEPSTPLDRVCDGARHTQHGIIASLGPIGRRKPANPAPRSAWQSQSRPCPKSGFLPSPSMASGVRRQEREFRAPPGWPAPGHGSSAAGVSGLLPVGTDRALIKEHSTRLNSTQLNLMGVRIYPLRFARRIAFSAPLTLFRGESCANLFSSADRNLFFQPLLNQYITGVPGRAARAKPSLIRAGPEYEQNVSRLEGRQYEQHAQLDVGSGNGGWRSDRGSDNGAGS